MQRNKNTEDNKKCIKNERNIPIIYLKSYDLIFNKGCVNVEGFKKYNNEYDNFEIIDNAVKYITNSDNLDKEKHLNRVKATKAEYDNKVKMWINNGSFLTYILAVVATGDLVYKLTDSKIAEKIGFWIIAVVLLFIIWYVFLRLVRNFDKDNKILKYLAYLEKQLESDK